jgi:uncharacterized protein (TIGR02452 family)
MRAKQARHIINKIVPAVLASNARARKGLEGSEVIVNPGPAEKYVKRKGQGRRKVKGNVRDEEETGDNGAGKPKGRSGKRNDSVPLDDAVSTLTLKPSPNPPKPRNVRIITTDTLTAAHLLTQTKHNTNKKRSNPCILNMASPLRPGGGVLTGATSQEEFLCARTTLLPCLKESFYRLPEYGGVYTSDVLVFRNSLPLGDSAGELAPTERWWVDVVSAGMLRFPELEGKESEEKRLGKKDRDIVESKIRAVLRIAQKKGVRKLVLGAWGCGAYGNPVPDIASAFRNVLSPSSVGKKGKAGVEVETFPSVEEVVFAISNRKMAQVFADTFGGDVTVEAGPGADEEEDEEEEDKVAEELRTKILEMESQLNKVWNPDLKARMATILEGLKTQLQEREGTPEESVEDDQDEIEDVGMSDHDASGDTDEDEEDESSDDDSDSNGRKPIPRKS